MSQAPSSAERQQIERDRQATDQVAAPTARNLARDRGRMYEDLPPEAQLERLRDVVRHLDQALADTRAMVSELLRHQHGVDGRLVVPMSVGQSRGAASEHRPEPAKRWL